MDHWTAPRNPSDPIGYLGPPTPVQGGPGGPAGLGTARGLLRGMYTVTMKDKGRGRVWLTVRDGVVVGAMGSDPARFVGLTIEAARHRARYGGRS